MVEIEEALVDWMRDGTVPHGPAFLADERLTWSRRHPAGGRGGDADATYDLVLLDVDNGPGLLVHDANAALYRAAFLRAVADMLRPGGAVAVWSPPSRRSCATRWRPCSARRRRMPFDVRLQGRDEQYWLYLAHRRRRSSLGGVSVSSMDGFRIEHDSMGEVRVPAGRPVAGADPAGGRELPDQRHRRWRPSTSRRSPR